MPIRAIARLIQTMLYAHRFFPYYVFNILGGVEEDGAPFRNKVALSCTDFYPLGSGAVYSFDPLGSYERETCRAAGSAQALVQPFLDNQVRRPKSLGTFYLIVGNIRYILQTKHLHLELSSRKYCHCTLFSRW